MKLFLSKLRRFFSKLRRFLRVQKDSLKEGSIKNGKKSSDSSVTVFSGERDSE